MLLQGGPAQRSGRAPQEASEVECQSAQTSLGSMQFRDLAAWGNLLSLQFRLQLLLNRLPASVYWFSGFDTHLLWLLRVAVPILLLPTAVRLLLRRHLG